MNLGGLMTKPEEIQFLEEIQWEALLAPLSEPEPVGEYLLYDDLYARVREARREDDPELSQGDWKTERKKADWPLVETLCSEALLTRSKDLQLAAWLTESWVYLHGVEGFLAGLRLLHQLNAAYWDKIHPPLDKDDPEQRLSPFIWMNEKFFLPLGRIRLSSPDVSDAEGYTFIERETAWRIEAGSPAEREAEAQGRPTRKLVANSMTLTPAAFYQRLAHRLSLAQEALADLSAQLDELAGKQAPSFGKLEKQLTGFQHIVQRALGEKPEEAPEQGAETDAPAEAFEGASGETAVPLNAQSIRSRKEAYQALAAAADYLLHNEPHSPAPYLVKRAISWGNLSLGELLLEVVNDDNDLRSIYNLLGISAPNPEE